MTISNRQKQIILSILSGNSRLTELANLSEFSEVTERTLQRDLGELVDAKLVDRQGEARAVFYTITNKGRLDLSISLRKLEEIFADENRPNQAYNFELLDILKSNPIFSDDEQHILDAYNGIFLNKLRSASADIIRRERERITIELSWKSSQIEGNTYTLLETESLIKGGIPGAGRSKEETIMILNHKHALDFSEQHKVMFSGSLDAQIIIELHKILTKNLDINHGLRKQLIGITGSNYKPLDNKFQIEEELGRFCDVVNAKQSPYEKALLVFAYICYLQPFNDGNKRTARILANAILYAHDSFPLSLRAVDVNTYKLAILAFYELGVLGNIKQVFIGQAKYASENYAI